MTEQDPILESLAAKLNSLTLSAEERAAFGELLGAHAEPSEVEGFAKRIYVGNLPVIQGFNLGMAPASKVIDVDPVSKVIDGDFGPATE